MLVFRVCLQILFHFVSLKTLFFWFLYFSFYLWSKAVLPPIFCSHIYTSSILPQIILIFVSQED